MQLTLKAKLDFLWQDFVAFIDQGVKEGQFAKEFKDNFKTLTRQEVLSVKNEGKNMPALRANEEAIAGKVILTLNDVANLVDAGYQDFIDGDYKGFMLMLEKYVENQDSTVFNQVNASMFEMSGNHYMPFLNEKGKMAFTSKSDELSEIIPASIKCAPYYFDFVNKQISWQDDIVFKGEVPSVEDVAVKVIDAENERLRDISLLMFNAENLKIIGFNNYL